MRTARSQTLAALTLASALAVSACSGDQPAGFDTSAQTPPASTAEQPANADGGAASGATPESADGTAAVVEPAQAKTIELEESLSRSTDELAFTLTAHRVVVQDYYVEAEVTIVNDSDQRLDAWYGSSTYMAPRLFDDRGRTYAYQVPAGYDSEYLRLEPGEGADVVLVFAGRVDPEARALTLDFSEIGKTWSQVTYEVPLDGAR